MGENDDVAANARQAHMMDVAPKNPRQPGLRRGGQMTRHGDGGEKGVRGKSWFLGSLAIFFFFAFAHRRKEPPGLSATCRQVGCRLRLRLRLAPATKPVQAKPRQDKQACVR